MYGVHVPTVQMFSFTVFQNNIQLSGIFHSLAYVAYNLLKFINARLNLILFGPSYAFVAQRVAFSS